MPVKSGRGIFACLGKVPVFFLASQKQLNPGTDKRPESQSKLRSHASKGFYGTIVPVEARRKAKGSIESEPTSPKVSCMGKVKQPKKAGKSTEANIVIKDRRSGNSSNKKRVFRLPGVFRQCRKVQKATAVPSLGKMKRLSSGREALSDFHWRSQTEGDGDPVEIDERKVVVAVQPKKQVNLWGRRTMAQPLRLHLIKGESS